MEGDFMKRAAEFGKSLAAAACNADFVEGCYLGTEVAGRELKERARWATRTILDEFHVVRYLMGRLFGTRSTDRDADFVEGRFYLDDAAKEDLLDRLNVARQRISDGYRVRAYCQERIATLAAA